MRDVFTCIEGLNKVKQLAIPKPSLLLLEERQIIIGHKSVSSLSLPKGSSPPPVMAMKNIKGKNIIPMAEQPAWNRHWHGRQEGFVAGGV